MFLPVAPGVFHRVKFRGVRRQAFQPDPAFLPGHKFLYQLAAMSRKAILNNQQLVRQMPLQVAQKIDDLLRLGGASIHAEVKVKQGQSGDGVQVVPIEVILQHGHLPFGCPGADPVWLLGHPAFIHKDQGSPFRQRFFECAAIPFASIAQSPFHHVPRCAPWAVESSNQTNSTAAKRGWNDTATRSIA